MRALPIACLGVLAAVVAGAAFATPPDPQLIAGRKMVLTATFKQDSAPDRVSDQAGKLWVCKKGMLAGTSECILYYTATSDVPGNHRIWERSCGNIVAKVAPVTRFLLHVDYTMPFGTTDYAYTPAELESCNRDGDSMAGRPHAPAASSSPPPSNNPAPANVIKPPVVKPNLAVKPNGKPN